MALDQRFKGIGMQPDRHRSQYGRWGAGALVAVLVIDAVWPRYRA